MIYRVSWQDYRGWRERDPSEPRPALYFRDYPTRAEAESEQRLQRLAGMTVCLVEMDPLAPPKRTRARPSRGRQAGFGW